MKKAILVVLLVLTVLTMIPAVAAVPNCNDGLISAHATLHELEVSQQGIDALHIASDHINCGL